MTASRLLPAAVLALGLSNAAGCANLERNLQDPHIWNKVAAISDRTQRNIDRYQQQKARDAREAALRAEQRARRGNIPVDGRWSFTTGTHFGFNSVTFDTAVNVIARVDGGLTARRENARGAGEFYAETSPNVFRSRSGHTYRFLNNQQAEWIKAGGGKAIKLYRK
ncbi:MAG: hypothetical protein AAGI15_17890 [Pseudomonadota bacterium]